MVEDQQPQDVDFETLLKCEKKRSEDYLTRLQYLQADLENFKKRAEREAEQTRNYCTERIVMQLLDVVDELELAVKNGEISPDTDTLLDGVEMTLKKLRKVLEQEGVLEIENPEGKLFDPARHNAVITQQDADVPENTVLEQIRKGYTLKGRVIRPTIVKVAVKPVEPKNNQSNQMEENKK